VPDDQEEASRSIGAVGLRHAAPAIHHRGSH
jgi:hypothetical protein